MVGLGWSRAITVGTCTESTIPTRGKETQPIGLKPDIILYRNRIINIYIHIYIIMIDYIYVQLHIDIYTVSKVYC